MLVQGVDAVEGVNPVPAVASAAEPAPTGDRQALRLLDVLEAVCRHGPAPLAVLVERTGIPRGAVWRALDVLRDKGWVRMRSGDNAFELRAPAAALFAQAQTSRPEVEAAMPQFARLAAVGPVHVDLGLFTGTGEFRIVETTRKDGYGRGPLSLTDDDIAIVGQLHLPPPSLVRHLTAFMERAGSEERQVVSSGEHVRTLRRLRGAEVLWHDDHAAVAVALRDHPGLALRAEFWRVSKSRVQTLAAAVAGILGRPQ